jgi:glycine C-acetyltransferase
MNKKEEIIKFINKLGLDQIGFSKAKRFEEMIPILKDFGEIQFVAQSIENRIDPFLHLDNASSFIAILFPYDINIYKPSKDEVRSSSSHYPDYHIVVRSVLEKLVNYIYENYGYSSKTFVDTEGFLDRYVAYLSGLGYFSRNTNIMNEKYGTAFNIGYILTQMPLEESQIIDGDCGSCNICKDACPSGAIGDYKLEWKKCISYLTQKTILEPFEEVLIKDKFYGCDICLASCPKNKKVDIKDHSVHKSDKILSTSNKNFKRVYSNFDFSWRGGRIIKRNINLININRSDYMGNVHELKYLKDKIQELKDQGVYRKLPVFDSANEAEINLNGKRVINLSSNNYLGFANHPKLKEAAVQAVMKYGIGAGAVRTIVGNMDIHEELESLLAQFKREEAVMIFQSGFNCNAGTIQAITDKGDLIISDELNHASIIDGVRLSKADKAVFKHSDMADLERVLSENKDKYANTLIITDGVFSMDGDIAKLPEIVELAEKYGAMTYVDDAHGSGVLGESGRGTVDHFHLHGRVDFTIGTLSKALGAIGGYVAGSQTMKEWLSHRGRPLLFSTSLPPAVVGALIEGVKLLMSTTEYTDRLWENSRYFKEKLSKLGYNIGNSQTPITPVIIGEEAKALEFSRNLYENGVFVSAIVFPTVAKGTGRVRCMVNASHTKEQLDRAIEAFEKVGKEMNLI